VFLESQDWDEEFEQGKKEMLAGVKCWQRDYFKIIALDFATQDLYQVCTAPKLTLDLLKYFSSSVLCSASTFPAINRCMLQAISYAQLLVEKVEY